MGTFHLQQSFFMLESGWTAVESPLYDDMKGNNLNDSAGA